uniref:Uncharacterized protein n=1 Tax=Ditylenchus dipsaci TaxID=166011 RepID=A0A915EH33_9BILA
MKCRKWLVSNNIQLEEETKFLMLHAIDLWTYSWDLQLFPDCLRQFYEEQKEQHRRQEILKERIEMAVTSSKRKISAPVERLRRQNTLIREYPTLNDYGDENQFNRQQKLSNVSFMSDVSRVSELEEVPEVIEPKQKVINDVGGHFAFEKEESAV